MMQPWCRADGEYCSQGPQACGKNLDYTFQKGMAGRDVLVLNKPGTSSFCRSQEPQASGRDWMR